MIYLKCMEYLAQRKVKSLCGIHHEQGWHAKAKQTEKEIVNRNYKIITSDAAFFHLLIEYCKMETVCYHKLGKMNVLSMYREKETLIFNL